MWIYLEVVFSGGNIAKYMAQETKAFSHINKNWLTVIKNAIQPYLQSIFDNLVHLDLNQLQFNKVLEFNSNESLKVEGRPHEIFDRRCDLCDFLTVPSRDRGDWTKKPNRVQEPSAFSGRFTYRLGISSQSGQGALLRYLAGKSPGTSSEV
jgi:hypothetical protein